MGENSLRSGIADGNWKNKQSGLQPLSWRRRPTFCLVSGLLERRLTPHSRWQWGQAPPQKHPARTFMPFMRAANVQVSAHWNQNCSQDILPLPQNLPLPGCIREHSSPHFLHQLCHSQMPRWCLGRPPVLETQNKTLELANSLKSSKLPAAKAATAWGRFLPSYLEICRRPLAFPIFYHNNWIHCIFLGNHTAQQWMHHWLFSQCC